MFASDLAINGTVTKAYSGAFDSRFTLYYNSANGFSSGRWDYVMSSFLLYNDRRYPNRRDRAQILRFVMRNTEETTMPLARDFLHPSPAEEKRKHKLKRSP
ncbi:hypothetical protein KM043_003755 [Ampulex compressa]|nr:hypothetical protein KM043_003755 [Ampulex compressa]